MREDVPIPSCESLVAGLDVRLVPGSLDSILASGAPTPPGVEGITWAVSSAADCCQRHFCARFISSPVFVTPGEYTIIATLTNSVLAEAFAPWAVSTMRSTTVAVVAGPAVTRSDVLWQHLKAGKVALNAKQWIVAQQHAQAILEIDANSALGCILKGDALLGAGYEAAARTAFAAAERLLELQQDTAVIFTNERIRNNFMNHAFQQAAPDEE